ncbi:MAG TPA: hypothetical protein VEL05_03015, partial [Candidatus Acidoferrum sp.]|nr:hypothetical protein [Candidatus Acidoferrum sp.]
TDPGQEEALARSYVERAWRRLEQEWTRARAGVPIDCPLCEPPFECPDSDGWPARRNRADAPRGQEAPEPSGPGTG